MSLLDKFDFSNGQLPPWLAPLISLTRPLATTLTAAMLPAGAFFVGIVGFVSPSRAMGAAEAVSTFLHGIPEGLFWLIGAITTGYTAAKTTEAIKAPPPMGGASPERPMEDEPPSPADTAPTGKTS